MNKMNLINCDNCQTDFRPSSDQLNFIRSSKEKGMGFVMLECGSCGRTFPFYLSSSPPQPEEPSMRTPIPGSHGYISLIDAGDEEFYGCGETGAIWRNKENLFRDIEIIIKKYAHRGLCYTKTSSGWVANPDEPGNMRELIDQEEVEELLGFVRD